MKKLLKNKNLMMAFNVLGIIGAVNWIAIGLINIDVVERVIGSIPMLQRTIYVIAGISGVLAISKCLKK